ncbi:hypothetical protein WJX84_000784, partial [Apatococcus fuscideae]
MSVTGKAFEAFCEVTENGEHSYPVGSTGLPAASWNGWQAAAQHLGLSGANAARLVCKAVCLYQQQQLDPITSVFQLEQDQELNSCFARYQQEVPATAPEHAPLTPSGLISDPAGPHNLMHTPQRQPAPQASAQAEEEGPTVRVQPTPCIIEEKPRAPRGRRGAGKKYLLAFEGFPRDEAEWYTDQELRKGHPQARRIVNAWQAQQAEAALNSLSVPVGPDGPDAAHAQPFTQNDAVLWTQLGSGPELELDQGVLASQMEGTLEQSPAGAPHRAGCAPVEAISGLAPAVQGLGPPDAGTPHTPAGGMCPTFDLVMLPEHPAMSRSLQALIGGAGGLLDMMEGGPRHQGTPSGALQSVQ